MSKTDRSGEENFTCHICARPVNLQNDQHTDEEGKIVHLDCYLRRIGSPDHEPPNPQHTG